MAEWHEHNQWADKLIYVPLEELAECVAGGLVRNSATGETSKYDVAFVLAEWRNAGDRLDGYIIPAGASSSLNIPSIGIRYGSGRGDYLSPGVRDRAKADELIEKYGADQQPGPKL